MSSKVDTLDKIVTTTLGSIVFLLLVATIIFANIISTILLIPSVYLLVTYVNAAMREAGVEELDTSNFKL
jgi:uncharacterized membrane protein YcaP (DUF421 family)